MCQWLLGKVSELDARKMTEQILRRSNSKCLAQLSQKGASGKLLKFNEKGLFM